MDEVRPVSRWREFGYSSARAAAEDFGNLQAAHYYCNQQKGTRLGDIFAEPKRLPIMTDGEW